MERYQYDCCLCFAVDIRNPVMCKICQKPTCLVCRKKSLANSRKCPHCKSEKDFIEIKFGEELKECQKYIQNCKKHSSQLLSQYCTKCKQFICNQCGVNHVDHERSEGIREKYFEIQARISAHKERIDEFQAELEKEKKEKVELIRTKEKETKAALDALMGNQKKYLKTKLESIKDSEVLEIKTKQMFLNTLKNEVNALIEKNQKDDSVYEKAKTYVLTKTLTDKCNELLKQEAKIQKQSTDIINNSNIFPSFHMEKLVIEYSKAEKKMLKHVQIELYNCTWSFKIAPGKGEASTTLPALDLIYKMKGFRKETQFKIIVEVVSNDSTKYSNIVHMTTETLTHDTCSGVRGLIKDNVYEFYSKDNKIIINFYIKYTNYLDIIQDALKASN